MTGCRHDGSERHDSSDVGGLQDTQVCMITAEQKENIGQNSTEAHVQTQAGFCWL